MPTRSPWDRVINATRASINTFLDSAIIFSIAMVVAAVWIKASDKRGADDLTSHEVYSSAIMAAFSSLPAYLLFLIDIQNKRRKYLRTATLIIIYALLLAEWIISRSYGGSSPFQALCISQSMWDYLKNCKRRSL
jgi:hypothetical protein